MLRIRQHTLRRAVVACLVAAFAATLAPAPAQAGGSPALNRVERSILRSLNVVRAEAGLPRLRRSWALSRAADFHNADMLGGDFFGHPCLNGRSMLERLSSYRRAKRLGEVLGHLPGTSSDGQVDAFVRMWLASPTHRASILTRAFRRVGVSRRVGVLGGRAATVVTVDFSSVR